jgi:5,6-dimethylbenzimidazole synthase
MHWPLTRVGKAHRPGESESEDRPGGKKGLPGQAAAAFPEGESMENPGAPPAHAFSDADRSAVYQAIFSRRDVRGQFLPDPVPDDVLGRVLLAAHHAPSVGFMQPWNFLVVRAPIVKQRVHDVFCTANAEAERMFPDEKRAIYSRLKLQGIVDSPVNLCVTCDRSRSGPVVLGRTHMLAMDLYSSVCAVQNLWLAARAEGLGVGWVSIFHQQALQDALGIPHDIVPIAYLCVGWVSHFNDRPELEKAGWLPRLALADLLYYEQWGETRPAQAEPLSAALTDLQTAIHQRGTFPA